MDAKIFRINYKSDFILTLESDAGWMTPFCIKFWTGAPSQAYFVGWDGETYTHCSYDPSEPTKLVVQFDDHHLPIGDLKFQIAYHFTVDDFPDDTEDEVLNQANITTEIDGQEYQVMLDFTGETAPEVQFSLPAYANEAQRIANEEERIAHEQQRISNEQQRIANEDARIAAEETRQRNEATRIAHEEARVSEFARLKRESQQATADANDAATLANQKAQLAADKAALADDAATLANQKAQLAADKAALASYTAQLANEKAALAQQKADYAQTQGGYAKDQGDYAKNQGNYAKEQGDTALADHQRAEADHGIAVDDHTQAGNDHTRAESDHGIAADDHTRAESDHTLAGTDHETAVADHTASSNATVAANAAAELAANKATEAGRVNATLNGSVVTITDKNGNSNSIDLLDATEERVQITVTKAQDAPQGTTVSGLVINAYYNDASVPTATVTTDANGMAVLRVPNGYKYRLVFPSQTGCETPWDVVHTAAVSQRSVEVEYMAASPTPLTEEVTVVLKNTAGVAQSGKTVTCSVGGSETQQVTDGSGEVTFDVALGSIYTITAPQIEGFYVRGGDYSVSHTADRGDRTIVYIYRIFVSGVFIVTGGGDEYTLEQFQQGVEQQQLQKSDALLIKVATQALQDAGGVFCFKIADIAVNSFTRKQWSLNTSYLFRSIPNNGNNVNQPYYYDGKTASALIQEEGDQQGIETPAVDWAMAQTVEVDGVTYNGFLMSIGQWNVAWGARDVIGDIIYYLDQTWRKLDQIAEAKWSSTQSNANSAWYWSTSAGNYGKSDSNVVLPAFAL